MRARALLKSHTHYTTPGVARHDHTPMRLLTTRFDAQTHGTDISRKVFVAQTLQAVWASSHEAAQQECIRCVSNHMEALLRKKTDTPYARLPVPSQATRGAWRTASAPG